MKKYFYVVAFMMLTVNAEEEKLPDLKPIMIKLEKIRSLKFKKIVPGKRQSTKEFKKFLEEEIESSMPKEVQRNMQRGLRALGLIKKEIDFGDSFVNALTSQAAAYYDPEKDTFFYVQTGMDEMMTEIVAAHELVHALQDQHFDLEKQLKEFEKPGRVRNEDKLLALRCLAEGEATYFQTVYQMQMMGQEKTLETPMGEEMTFLTMASMNLEALIAASKSSLPSLDPKSSMAESIRTMDQIPPFILDPLLAAYMKGAYFVSRLKRDGGLEKINATWKDLPRSTEQCLHPKKFLKDIDEPTEVSLPDLKVLKDKGYQKIDSAIHGEYYLNMLLRFNGVNDQMASFASAGWDGDLYEAWAQGDKTIIVLKTIWDSEVDATQFINAWKVRVNNKWSNPNFSKDEMSYSKNGKLTGVILKDGGVATFVEGEDEKALQDVIQLLTGVSK